MNEKKNIFITGGAGLIGFTLTKTLLQMNYNVFFDLKEQLIIKEDSFKNY